MCVCNIWKAKRRVVLRFVYEFHYMSPPRQYCIFSKVQCSAFIKLLYSTHMCTQICLTIFVRHSGPITLTIVCIPTLAGWVSMFDVLSASPPVTNCFDWVLLCLRIWYYICQFLIYSLLKIFHSPFYFNVFVCWHTKASFCRDHKEL